MNYRGHIPTWKDKRNLKGINGVFLESYCPLIFLKKLYFGGDWHRNCERNSNRYRENVKCEFGVDWSKVKFKKKYVQKNKISAQISGLEKQCKAYIAQKIIIKKNI